MTRKEAVLKVLRSRRWTLGHEFTRPSTGGSEGLRRLRELRAEGYDIETRRSLVGSSFEYRLVGTPS